MPTTVLLDPGCCPAGSPAAQVVRDAGAKTTQLTGSARQSGLSGSDGPAGLLGSIGSPDGWADGGLLREDGSLDPSGWGWRVADVLGLHREALLAGCPVPLAGAVTVWQQVADEVASDRWDVVVVPVPPVRTAALVEAPQLLLRVVDARLDALAAHVAEVETAATGVADLLAVRPALVDLVALAGRAAGLGTGSQHRAHGCDRPGGLALAALDRDDVAALAVEAWAPRPATGVRADGEDFVWWVQVPPGADPQLQAEADRLLLAVGGQHRVLRLPSVLTRCHVRAATVVADRLEVRFAPDPDAWR